MTSVRSCPFVGVSLKLHLGHFATERWLNDLSGRARASGALHGVELAVLPAATALTLAASSLKGSQVAYGAQDGFWEDSGPFTGGVSPSSLRELGCRYLEVGHAERRAFFGEDDQIIARKAVAGVRNGLTAIICVGETEQGSVVAAAAECVRQLLNVLTALEETRTRTDVVVAYEPVWAIGAEQPASPDRINAVLATLRRELRTGDRIIYGGSAGPGLFRKLNGADGLFLGRSALSLDTLFTIIAEVGSARRD